MFRSWLRVPNGLSRAFLIIIPIIVSQILQRLFPIIDNRYFNMLGNEATYLHNIQYNFVTLGQFIGLATYISSLVFWKKEECLLKQGNILIKHIMASGLFTMALGILCWIFLPTLLTHYQIDPSYYPLAMMYFKIGIINMIFQAIFGGLDGMLVGTQQQKYSMFLAAFLLLGNWTADHYAVHVLYSDPNLANTIRYC
jgi:Na+-driven multidrug efflux pump